MRELKGIYETPMKKRRHLFSTRVVKQMANPRVRRTSGFHFLTTSVEKRCLRLSWSFMLSHKVSTLAKIYLNNKTSFASQSSRFLNVTDLTVSIYDEQTKLFINADQIALLNHICFKHDGNKYVIFFSLYSIS